MSTINATTLRATTIQHTNGTNALTIDSSGRILANQPHSAARGPESNTTTTNGSNLNFNNAFTNIGSHFNTSTFRFTAPVTGSYLITVSLFTNGGTGRMAIKINNAAYQNLQAHWGNTTSHWSQSVIWRLNANDFVTVGDWQNTPGASPYMGHSHFCCYLLG
jgi:hypothetical protein